MYGNELGNCALLFNPSDQDNTRGVKMFRIEDIELFRKVIKSKLRNDWKFKIFEKEVEISSLVRQGLSDQDVMKISHVSAIALAKHKKNILRKIC